MGGTESLFRSTIGALMAGLAVVLLAASATHGLAQDGQKDAAPAVPAEIIAVVSGGLWRAGTEEQSEADTDAAPPDGGGYYRAIAVRSPDNTSRLYFQKIDLSTGKPEILETVDVEELASMPAYITDMRPETSTGVTDYEGFAAYVYLKEDPSAVEPDTWELFVDEFGEHEFLPASN